METKTVDKFQLIPIGKVMESKTNPRKHYDENAMKELISSVKAKGVHVPLLVRSVNSHFEIVAGSRRFRASKAAGLKEVPAIIKDLTEQDVLEIQVIENLQREDIHPLDEAEGYQKLMDQGKYDVKLLAEKLGKSDKYIYGRLRLNRLIKPLRDLYDSGFLQTGHLLVACKYNKETQEKICIALQHTGRDDWEDIPSKVPKNQKADTAPRVEDLQKWLNDNAVYDLSKVKFDITDKDLHPNAGDCISCRKNTSNDLVLFEGSKQNLCTDRTCRETKTRLWILNKYKELKKKNADLRCVSTSGYQIDKIKIEGINDKIYGDNDYLDSTATTNSCPDVHQCLVVHVRSSYDLPKFGTVILRCFNKNCKKHNPYRSYSSGSSSKADNKAKNAYNAERKIRIQELNNSRKELHLKTLQAFAKKPIANLKQFLITVIITTHKAYVDHIEYEALKSVKSLPGGLKEPKKDHWGSEGISDKQLNSLNETQLMNLFLCNYTSKDVQLNNWQDYERCKGDLGKSDRLTFWAKKLLTEKTVNEIIAKHKLPRKSKGKPKKKNSGKTNTAASGTDMLKNKKKKK